MLHFRYDLFPHADRNGFDSAYVFEHFYHGRPIDVSRYVPHKRRKIFDIVGDVFAVDFFKLRRYGKIALDKRRVEFFQRKIIIVRTKIFKVHELFITLFDCRGAFVGKSVDKRFELLLHVCRKLRKRHRFAFFGDGFLRQLFFDFALSVGKEIFDNRRFHGIRVFYVLKENLCGRYGFVYFVEELGKRRKHFAAVRFVKMIVRFRKAFCYRFEPSFFFVFGIVGT